MGTKSRHPMILFLSLIFLATVSLSVGYTNRKIFNNDFFQRQKACRSHHFDQCQKSCSQMKGGQYYGCLAACQDSISNHDRRRPEEESEREQQQEEKQQQEREGQWQKQNPYHFESESFQTRYRTPHGRIRVLPRFDQISHLRVLKNFRIVELEARPQTFVLPHHSDAHYILVVLEGKGLFTIVNRNSRETYNVEYGDVLRIHAGTTSYAANTDDNQNLRVVKLAMPVNTPGQFQDFFPSGIHNPKSYYRAFSRDTLEAAFNTHFVEIRRTLFGEQKQQEQSQLSESKEGVIIKASKEQLGELSQKAKSSQIRDPSSTQAPFNLKNVKLRFSNNYGSFFEARHDEQQQLQGSGVSVSITELKEGGLLLPYYDTEATTVLMVVFGEGQAEMASSHVYSQRQEEEDEKSGQIQGITAELSKGDVLVIPPGHPFALRAHRNIRWVSFIVNGLNSQDNRRHFLAGQGNNVINQIERTAKELSFGGSGEEVEKLFMNQKEAFFVSSKPKLLRKDAS